MQTKAPKKRILVVDDEEETLVAVGNILKRANYKVDSATSGKDALELTRKLRPDLIILDIVLPDMDGGDVASELSQDYLTSNIPIVFLTGILKKDEEYEGMKTGRRYVIAKPVTKDGLLSIVAQAIPF